MELASNGSAGCLQAPFDVAAMRPHLAMCLSTQSVRPFPKRSQTRGGTRRKVNTALLSSAGVEIVL